MFISMFEGLECLGGTRMRRGSLFCVRDDAAEPSFLSPELCDLVGLGRLGLFLLLFFDLNIWGLLPTSEYISNEYLRKYVI